MRILVLVTWAAYYDFEYHQQEHEQCLDNQEEGMGVPHYYSLFPIAKNGDSQYPEHDGTPKREFWECMKETITGSNEEGRFVEYHHLGLSFLEALLRLDSALQSMDFLKKQNI